jgi:small GTP-binding protein
MQGLQKKICLLGMFGVGKTSLVRRFVENQFDDKYLSTLGVKVSRKRIQLDDQAHPHLDLLLWDIASLDELGQHAQSYFRGAHGALVVHDLTRPESAKRLAGYCATFLQIAPQARLVFAGNKTDLVDMEKLDTEAFKELTGQPSAPHFFTSAKSGENVEAAFLALANLLVPSLNYS